MHSNRFNLLCSMNITGFQCGCYCYDEFASSEIQEQLVM